VKRVAAVLVNPAEFSEGAVTGLVPRASQSTNTDGVLPVSSGTSYTGARRSSPTQRGELRERQRSADVRPAQAAAGRS
jgi:hypothetical protein